MTSRIALGVVPLFVACSLLAIEEADAQTSSCTVNSASCLTVTNHSTTADGSAVSGTNSNGIGVFGKTDFGTGLVGQATGTDGMGILGTTLYGTYGVRGTSTYGVGVSGEATDSNTTGTGVEGISPKGYGVSGKTSGDWNSNAAGVYGTSWGTAAGVKGYSAGGTAVAGLAGAGGYGIYGESSGTGFGIYGYNASGAANGGYAIYAGGPAGGTSDWHVDSDQRLKKEIQSSPHGLSDLLKLRPVVYKLKDGDGATRLGLIAQEVEKVVPEVVQTNGRTGFLSVGYATLVPVVIKAAQEQQQMLQEQKDTIARLEVRIAKLERGQSHVSSLTSGAVAPSLALALLPVAVVVMRKRGRRAVIEHE